MALTIFFAGSAQAQAQACSGNEIVVENCRAGSPPSEWEVSGSGDAEIQGFATDISVNQGETVRFKIHSSGAYRVDIYRMGWYGGDGARQVASFSPLSGMTLQPACEGNASTGLVDCGNWSESTSWAVPADAVSGIYFARLVRPTGASHVPFIVRDDDGASELLFQTADTTWQAYNQFGGNSLYTGSPAGRAYKVSYNRPFTTRGYAPEDWVFNAEYPMVRWLERNGYDVSYFTGVDSDRLGAELREHRTFLSVGHDEYWSGTQRANVEAARDDGVNLAFFSGNEIFWKTRWEDGHRTLVSYKETHANAKIDPTGVWTGTWRDPRPFNPQGASPENALTGTLFTVNCCTIDLEVPAAEGRLRLWRNTGLAGLAPGTAATLGDDIVGYEWDEDLDNGARPAGLVRLSSVTTDVPQRIEDHGSSYGPGTATHSLTLHRDANGAGPDALVFGAGTVQWSWGLDNYHDRGGLGADVRLQQATANLFADMGVQPVTLQGDLIAAAASTDCVAPTSAPSAPAIAVSAGTPATVSGTALDGGGGQVGGVEVSVDGGASWHPATGRESWSYSWTPGSSGQVTVLSRATDDGGLIQGTGCDPAASAGASPAPPKPPASARDRKAPRLVVGPRKVRVSRRGYLKLKVACPRGEKVCRVDLKLRRRGATLARKRFTVAGGKSRVVTLRLSPQARRRLARARKLGVDVVAVARDSAGNRAVAKRRIVLAATRARKGRRS